MKRNFNIIKNLDVPESWIENAVNIPHTATKKHFKPYLIGTAASVVAVSTAVLFFNSKLSIQEFPMSPSASTLPQESTCSAAHQGAPSTSVKATEPKEETQAMQTIPEYSQSELNRQQVENDSSDKLVEPTDNIVEGSSPVELAKAVKNDVEVEGFRKAYLQDGIVQTRFFKWLEEQVSSGARVTESDASDKLHELREGNGL